MNFLQWVSFLNLSFIIVGTALGRVSYSRDHYLSHKSAGLDIYLNMIAANMAEKTEIVQHMVHKPEGVFLDIGTGGDGIAAILASLNVTSNTTVIAGDIDSKILENIPRRHPEVVKNLIGAHSRDSGARLILEVLDATDMNTIQTSSLDGVNASAIVHEIVSYAGGREGVRKFLHEVERVLRPDGVFVYRDPESVFHRNELVTATLHAQPLKYFANIFLPKFLDRRYTHVAHKAELYTTKPLFFEFYTKSGNLKLLNYDDYCKMPTFEIDFNKPYRIILPRALCQELERHYLMFLHEYASLLFVKAHFDVERNAYQIAFRAARAREGFLRYCERLGIPIIKGELTIDAYQALQLYQMSIPRYLSIGLVFKLMSPECLVQLKEIFDRNGFNFDDSVHGTDHFYILDYKSVALLWNEVKHLFVDNHFCSIAEESLSLLDWLQREGEEIYFYAAPDEFIAFVGSETLRYDDRGNATLLAPMGKAFNKSVLRQGYSSFLSESLVVSNEAGTTLPHEDRKRIIHFAKMNVENAINIYQSIIKHDPARSESIISFLELLKNKGYYGN